MAKAKVYFTKDISPESVLKMYKQLGIELPGKVAVKVHSGEAGNKNYLHPEFFKPVIDYVKGTVVECNTAYGGARNTTAKHKKLINDHKWNSYFNVDIMDGEGDFEVAIPNGKKIKKNYLGNNIKNYDSMLVLIHFKGHAMGGYGGALKQLSIGCGSSAGKAYQHTAGVTNDPKQLWSNVAEQIDFTEAMADAASSVTEMFKGKIAYVASMMNISKDCDCDGNAAPPCMKDIGILSSLDPVALDRACNDLVIKSDDPGKQILIDRIESLEGYHTIEAAEALGIGTTDYELIEVK